MGQKDIAPLFGAARQMPKRALWQAGLDRASRFARLPVVFRAREEKGRGRWTARPGEERLLRGSRSRGSDGGGIGGGLGRLLLAVAAPLLGDRPQRLDAELGQ